MLEKLSAVDASAQPPDSSQLKTSAQAPRLEPGAEPEGGTALSPLESWLTKLGEEGFLLNERTEEHSMLLAASAFEEASRSNTASPVKGVGVESFSALAATRRDLRFEMQQASKHEEVEQKTATAQRRLSP